MQYNLIHFLHFKQCYTPYENENKGKTIVRLNTVILTNIKVKSIKDVYLTARASNNLRVDVIRLVAVNICDDAHDKIPKTSFQGKN